MSGNRAGLQFGGTSMRRLSIVFAAAALLASAAVAFAADPIGEYSVEGTNPGGNGKYSGTVTVEKTGETYRVIWVVGDTDEKQRDSVQTLLRLTLARLGPAQQAAR